MTEGKKLYTSNLEDMLVLTLELPEALECVEVGF